MALIKMGAIITAISGRIGGQTFGQGPAGSYLRNTGRGNKTLGLLHTKSVNALSATSSSWRNMSNAQRTAYKNQAVNFTYVNNIGETKQYTGYRLFVWQNLNLLLLGEAAQTTPPAVFSFDAMTLFTASATLPAQWDITGTPTQEGVEYLIFASAPGSQGISAGYKNKYLLAAVSAVTLAAGYDMYTTINARFGVVPSGAKMWISADAIVTASGNRLNRIAEVAFTAP